jgi:hypothetical protein
MISCIGNHSTSRPLWDIKAFVRVERPNRSIFVGSFCFCLYMYIVYHLLRYRQRRKVIENSPFKISPVRQTKTVPNITKQRNKG